MALGGLLRVGAAVATGGGAAALPALLGAVSAGLRANPRTAALGAELADLMPGGPRALSGEEQARIAKAAEETERARLEESGENFRAAQETQRATIEAIADGRGLIRYLLWLNSFARPAALYGLVGGTLIAVWGAASGALPGEVIASIAALLTPIAGVSGYYVRQRTRDKAAGKG